MTKVPVPMNVPNILTIFRFLLIPPAVILVFSGYYITSLVIFTLACVTDMMDGFIARRLNQVSQAGVLLDPLADKTMAVLMVIALTVKGIFPLFVAVIIFVKEGLMIIGGIILYKKNVIEPSNIIGKAAAVLFNAALGLSLLNEFITKEVYLYTMYAALVLTVIAFIQYTYLNAYKKLKDKNSG